MVCRVKISAAVLHLRDIGSKNVIHEKILILKHTDIKFALSLVLWINQDSFIEDLHT